MKKVIIVERGILLCEVFWWQKNREPYFLKHPRNNNNNNRIYRIYDDFSSAFVRAVTLVSSNIRIDR